MPSPRTKKDALFVGKASACRRRRCALFAMLSSAGTAL
jgi:hypothetical protein